jgi:hypothetical protein
MKVATLRRFNECCGQNATEEDGKVNNANEKEMKRDTMVTANWQIYVVSVIQTFLSIFHETTHERD